MWDSQTTLEGTLTLGQAVLTGAVMGVYYDVFRILRRIFRFGYATIAAQDVFFFVTSAFGVFFAGTYFTGGTIRISFVAAVLLGWGIYATTAGALLLLVVGRLVVYIKCLLRYILKLLPHFPKTSEKN